MKTGKMFFNSISDNDVNVIFNNFLNTYLRTFIVVFLYINLWSETSVKSGSQKVY